MAQAAQSRRFEALAKIQLRSTENFSDLASTTKPRESDNADLGYGKRTVQRFTLVVSS
jgi:hypothetical protein